MMHKVLLITYYWPPTAGAASQRLFAFGRYLPDHGFRPIVLTPSAEGRHPRDFDGLLFEVNAWDPAARLKRRSGGGGAVTAPAPARWIEWIRLNAFIPDTKICWRRPALRRACAIIEREQPSIIFSSAPPYTVHRVALALQQRYQLPWVADFRDPWLENHAYNTVPRTALTLGLTRRMETAVLHKADHIVTALESQRGLLKGKTLRDPACFSTIHNGYDPKDFVARNAASYGDTFYLSHFGTVYTEGFDWHFFEQLAHLVRTHSQLNKQFVLRMIGTVPEAVRTFLAARFDVRNLLIRGPVPHADVIPHLTTRQLLLLLVNRGTLHGFSHPSKLFEYMASGNPVLAVGPGNHEAMDILSTAYGEHAIICANGADWQTRLIDRFTSWRNHRMPQGKAPPDYDRRHLTAQLAAIFDRYVPPA